MSIRVGKYDYKSQTQPETDGYTNILIHTTGPLSPYTMKDDDGVIMENFWQFSKVWEHVSAISQPLSQYYPKCIRWKHPSEIHIKDDNLTPKYWDWRKKGFHHERWVRYPNSYKLHRESIGSVVGTPDDYEFVDYVEARREIYYPKYREIAVSTKKFKELLKAYKSGENIQINEVDGPTYSKEYPYNLTEGGSILVDEKILKLLINNPEQPFGHGYSLAACILGIEGFI
uniref:Uncharacterized protein n=1 Tax=Pithovirus LCDPAC01 TaxID=2506600 RepID=A0A481YN65_9VIRU|nr:MAG: uncharacterized protein LCDPAC01_02410 [Pithovirus LCDPAC01]